MKKTASNYNEFKTLDNQKLNAIKGGQWVEVRNPDGSTTLIWV